MTTFRAESLKFSFIFNLAPVSDHLTDNGTEIEDKKVLDTTLRFSFLGSTRDGNFSTGST